MVNKLNRRGFGAKDMIVSLAIICLFAISMLFFLTGFLVNNNSNSTLLTSNQYGINQSATLLNNSLVQFTSTANDARTQLANASPSPLQFVFLIFEAAFFIPKSFLVFMGSSLINLETVIFPSILGNTGLQPLFLVFNVLLSIGLLVGVIYLVRIIRTGDER